MGLAFFKSFASVALLSALVLALNCGPTCEIDLVGSPESSPCHQDGSRKGPGCEWDSASISLEKADSFYFKVFLQSADLNFISTYPFRIRFEMRSTLSASLFEELSPDSRVFSVLSSIRLLI